MKDGLVVRAHMGVRNAYRPIETPLSATADIADVAAALRQVFPFPAFYVADLDAIENGARPLQAAELLAGLRPAPEVWLDAGFSSSDDIAATLDNARTLAVLGSESQVDTGLLRRFGNNPRLLLSLDFRANAFLGPPEILEQSELWPGTVIVMTLGKVGAGDGPDYDVLRKVKTRAGNRAVIAAGGVRDAADLRRLEVMGIAGALVASSLHNGALSEADISSFMGPSQAR
ncbi:nickel transporter (plasmid) [Sinorhizobium sp. BG8]|nr:nickel transporter [Sinorhizobium sp. BG8]